MKEKNNNWKQFIKWEEFPPSYKLDDCYPWDNPKEKGVDFYEYEYDIDLDFRQQCEVAKFYEQKENEIKRRATRI